MQFFLTGVRDTATQATDTARRILALFETDRARIEALGRAASSAVRVHLALQGNPMLSIPAAARQLNLSQPTVTKALDHLARLKIVKEITGRQRRRLFSYDDYVRILSEGTEPLAGTAL